MKHFKTYLAAMALALSGCQSATDSCGTTELWYAQPAKVWMESLPIGNGRLGAMTYGGIEEEKLALNESTMWSGQYNENQNKPFGREKMNQLRKLFFEGKLSEGNRIAGDNLHGNQTSFGTHLPIGDLKMQFIYPEGKVTDYRRSLSLDEAVSSVSFNSGGVNGKTECENRINAVKVRFGLGEINSEIYTATMSELNSRLTEIRRDLEDAGKNLSNMMNYINQTIEISCKLGSLWRDSDFSNRQKIQNLVYPGGIYFDKKNDDYRTENENEVFRIFRRFTAVCKGGKEKATNNFHCLSPSVGMRRLERPTPTSRT